MTVADPSRPPSVAANIANSVLLAAISRLSTIGLIPVAVALAIVSWIYISYRFDVQVQATTVAASVAAVAADHATTVASDLVQTKQALADDERQTIKFRDDTAKTLDKHSDTLVEISNSLAAINAKIDAWHRQGQP